MAKRTNGCAPIVGLLVIVWLLSRCGGNETPPAPPSPPIPTLTATTSEDSGDSSVTEAVEEALDGAEAPPSSRSQRQEFLTSDLDDTGDEGPIVYYRNCRSARAAGVTPIHEGEPGYAYHLDRDHDGIACE